MQIVETSGAGDAEPLARMLPLTGFRLDAIVAVVDAEAGAVALATQEVARQQVTTAPDLQGAAQ